MGSRCRIGVRISPEQMLWTGSHYGANVRETAPVLYEHYNTPAEAVRLAGLPYMHGGIAPYDVMVANQSAWAARMVSVAQDRGIDVAEYVRDRVMDRPAEIISSHAWRAVWNTPEDVETVYIYHREEWYYAKLRGDLPRDNVVFTPIEVVVKAMKKAMKTEVAA